MSDDIFADGDPFNDPAWQKIKRRRGQRMIGCPLSWFEWAVPLVKSKGQLAFVLLLYRRCCICKSATVTVPTHEFESIGISRYGKRTLLLALEQAGVVRVEATRNGQVGKVTLANWPEPA
jgi:proline racemase